MFVTLLHVDQNSQPDCANTVYEHCVTIFTSVTVSAHGVGRPSEPRQRSALILVTLLTDLISKAVFYLSHDGCLCNCLVLDSGTGPRAPIANLRALIL
jgi:hypothetical protein